MRLAGSSAGPGPFSSWFWLSCWPLPLEPIRRVLVSHVFMLLRASVGVVVFQGIDHKRDVLFGQVDFHALILSTVGGLDCTARWVIAIYF